MGESRPDIIVAGTGPAGLIAALALSETFGVTLAGPPARLDDRRTTALMNPALAFLDRLGVLGAIEAETAPLEAIRIVDATDRLIRGPVVTFHAGEIGEKRFGLNVPNSALNAALEHAVGSRPRIDRRNGLVERWEIGREGIRAALPGGETVAAALAVAADGRLSPAREAAGITVSTRSSPQAALVLNFAHGRPHGGVSTEFHTTSGPFTLVPLPGRRSSLVWVERPETARDLAALDDEALSDRIERKMQSMLGRVEVEPGRQIYPLSATLPRRFGAHRVALVGEAAHVFPPIGAQGLNLGIRDISALLDIAAAHRADPGAPAALAAYDAARGPDIRLRAGAVNLLNRSLLSDMLPAQLARGAGLGMLRAFAPLRALFMREGLQPGSGFAAIRLPSWKEVGR